MIKPFSPGVATLLLCLTAGLAACDKPAPADAPAATTSAPAPGQSDLQPPPPPPAQLSGASMPADQSVPMGGPPFGHRHHDGMPPEGMPPGGPHEGHPGDDRNGPPPGRDGMPPGPPPEGFHHGDHPPMPEQSGNAGH